MNEAQIEHWNGPEARRWVELQDRYDRQLAPFANELLRDADIRRGEQVLDLGCGSGTTTLLAATQADRAVGVDISALMLEHARAAARGITNIDFVQADVQMHSFDSSIDVAMSRFGVMFFDDPAAAFTNVATSLRSGGRLVFVCWQELARNDWLFLPGLAAAQYLPLPETPAGGPGPFSLADRGELATLLASAGFNDIDISARNLGRQRAPRAVDQ